LWLSNGLMYTFLRVSVPQEDKHEQLFWGARQMVTGIL
jgi:hypothetical protein